MGKLLKALFFTSLLILCINNCFAQEKYSVSGPVFEDMGGTYDLPYFDFVPDSSQVLKAIFDIERLQEDPNEVNPIITSLHRYINMHVRKGIPLKNIHLAFVLHGVSSKDALTNEAYKSKYGVENPNIKYIQALNEIGVHLYICGQSATWIGYKEEDIMPEVKIALSAMTVLTVYQMNGYAMIRF